MVWSTGDSGWRHDDTDEKANCLAGECNEMIYSLPQPGSLFGVLIADGGRLHDLGAYHDRQI
jgi:hypothetical protein